MLFKLDGSQSFSFFSYGPRPPAGFRKSEIAQFCYTSENNIGDYLPTLGIWEMLGSKTDLYSITNKGIDFSFINKNYRAVIVGGAGILGKDWESFFERLIKECTLPIIVWGVGICLRLTKPLQYQGLSQEIAKKLEERAVFLNVRDTLTVDHYDFDKAEVAVCPSALYVSSFKKYKTAYPQNILYVGHEELVPPLDNQKIMRIVRESSTHFTYTNNIFTTEKSIEEIEAFLKNYYCQSKLIVTTRLHGAIIAYGLEIPYIAIPFDKKLISFHENYGNGILVRNSKELLEKLVCREPIIMRRPHVEPQLTFGVKVKNFLISLH